MTALNLLLFSIFGVGKAILHKELFKCLIIELDMKFFLLA